MKFVRNDWRGGLHMQFDPSRIGANEYPLLFNGRCRDGIIRPVRKPARIENTPEAKYQGVYAANQYALLIAGGKAYIKDYGAGGNYNEVPDLQMDPNIDVIFAETIPSSTRNFTRVPVSNNKNEGINLVGLLNQSEAAVMLQDGITQPWIIRNDGTARITKSFNEWTLEDPEYVPIGKQMLFDSGILYIAAPDGRLIYRMCTDRPLNGMVSVTTPNGDKQATEELGGAATVAHAISHEVLTCLAGLNTPDQAFFASTHKYGAMVVPDFVNTLFGEPLFDNIGLFTVGPINQFSFVETNGDSIFVTSKGIRSFNATLALRNESKNTPFSARIQRAFRGVIQTNPSVGKYDDMIFFSVKTVYGDAVVVYDETLEQFVSLDQWAGIGRVKQFATVHSSTQEVLLFITEDNKLYEYEMGAGVETAKLYIGDFIPEGPDMQQKPFMLYVSVENAEAAGTLTVTPYVDRQKQSNAVQSYPVTKVRAPDAIPMTVPFGDDSKDNTQVIPFNVGRIAQGRKVGFMLELDCAAEISSVLLTSVEQEQVSGLKAAADRFGRLNGIPA